MFSTSEALKAGWRGTWKHFGFWFLALIIALVLGNVSALFELFGFEEAVILILLASLFGAVIQALMSLGFFQAALSIIRGQRPAFSMLFENWPQLLKYFGGYILYSLIVLGGLLLLIIPGILWALRFQFYVLGIVDQKLGPVAAIKHSGKIARGAELKLLGFVVLTFLINLAGMIVFFVGLFTTLPLTIIALTHIYQQLLEHHKQTEPDASSAPAPAPAEA